MLCSTQGWLVVLFLCPTVIQGYGEDFVQREPESPSYLEYGEPCANKESVVGLQSSVESLSTSITSQFNQVNEAVQTKCDIKTVLKTIMSGMQSLMSANIGELKAVLAEVATKTDLQTLESKQVEMALAQVATDDQLANSTMLLQMELQTIKDQVADKGDFQLVKKAIARSTSILRQELDLVKKELSELKKTCHDCHKTDQKVCVHNKENFYEGSFDIGCKEHCECFANSTMVCQNRCNSPYFSVGSFSHDPSCTETPSDSDKCCVTVKCATNRTDTVQSSSTIVAVSTKIPLNASNILKHGGFRPGGAGPENLLHDNGFWNPNPPPWYVAFDFHRRFTVESLELSNFGDVKHDVAQFTLETTDNITNIDDYKLVTRATNVQKGTNDPQLFTFSPATGRYWRFNITKTHSIFQPWIERLNFHGHPAKEFSCLPRFRQMGKQCLSVVLGPVNDKTWQQARAVCQVLGGDLAQLYDTTHILHHISSELGREDWKFWVGAELKNKMEEFRWRSGKKVSNWEDGQPDNGGFKLFDHSDEHCVELQAWNGKYNDQDCDEERSFICEIDPLEKVVVEKTINLTQSVIGTNQLLETTNFHQEEQQAQQQTVGQTEQEQSDQDEQQVSLGDVWRNCDDVKPYGVQPNGTIRNLFPFEDDKDKKVSVFCDEKTDGGGWTVIQHRGPRLGDNNAERIDFNKLWHEYRDGFGDPIGDHWLGLDAISAITNQGPTELLILLGDFEGQHRRAHYDYFVVHNHTTKYTMEVSRYNGDAGDSFSYHSGKKFTTIDADNDGSGSNCAYEFGGAWWHDSCHESNLNGKYLGGVHSSYADGIEWKAWHGYRYSLNTTTMMVRPRRDAQDDLQQGVIHITAL